ncbi:MAG: hypothetical protein PUJ09_02315 [Eubacteriales bacterium]|nr:hypothetical protein [Eubacteriales bacterium]
MKKAFVLIIALATLVACLAIPVGAADGDIIYSEDFNSAKTLEEIGWTVENALTTSSAKYTFEGGQLVIDNLDSTVGTSVDSFATIIDGELMKPYTAADYSYQCTVTYLEAENSERYMAFLVNYDGGGNYYSVAPIKACGYGANQARFMGKWTGAYKWNCMDEPGSGLWMSSLDKADTVDVPMITKLYGEEFDKASYAMLGRTFTVRVQVSTDKGQTVYITPLDGVNASKEIKVSEYGPEAYALWGCTDAYGIGIMTSLKVKLALDDLIVWTGTGAAPSMPVSNVRPSTPAETTADTTSAVPADTTTATPVDTTTAAPVDTTTVPKDTSTAVPSDTTTASLSDTATPSVTTTAPADDSKGCGGSVIPTFGLAGFAAIIAIAGVAKKNKE